MVLALSLGFVLLLTFGSNPVYSILTLISSSLCLGLILLIYGLQFVSFLIVLIYIGAVSVLFLFVVMMINFRLNLNQFPLTETFVFWLLSSTNFVALINGNYKIIKLNSYELTNFESLGTLLYQTSEVQLLLIVSLVLFVAMLGAISLTYIASENYRTQHIPTQTALQINKSYRLVPYQSNLAFIVLILVVGAILYKNVCYVFLLVPFFIIFGNVYLNYKRLTLLKNCLFFSRKVYLSLAQALTCCMSLAYYFGNVSFLLNFGLIGLIIFSVDFSFEGFSTPKLTNSNVDYSMGKGVFEKLLKNFGTKKFMGGSGIGGYLGYKHLYPDNEIEPTPVESKTQETKVKTKETNLNLGGGVGYQTKTVKAVITDYKK